MDSCTILGEALSESQPAKKPRPRKYISGCIAFLIMLIFWSLIKISKIKSKDRTVFMYSIVVLMINLSIIWHAFPLSITIYTSATYFSIVVTEFVIIFRTIKDRSILSILRACYHTNTAYIYDTKDNNDNFKANIYFLIITTAGNLLCVLLSFVIPNASFLTLYAVYCLVLFLLMVLCRSAEIAYYYRAKILEPMQKLYEDLVCQTQGDARDLVQEFLDDWYSKEPSPQRAAFFYAEYMQAILLFYSLFLFFCLIKILNIPTISNTLGTGGSALVKWGNFYIVLLVFAGIGIYGFLLKLLVRFEVRRTNRYIIELGFGEDNKGLKGEYDMWYNRLTPFFKL